MKSTQQIHLLLDTLATLRRHRSTCLVEPHLAMGDSRLSALNLNWFFRSFAVLCLKTTLGTHSDKQSLGYEILLTNTQRKVRILMFGFPFANNA